MGGDSSAKHGGSGWGAISLGRWPSLHSMQYLFPKPRPSPETGCEGCFIAHSIPAFKTTFLHNIAVIFRDHLGTILTHRMDIVLFLSLKDLPREKSTGTPAEGMLILLSTV